MKKIMLFWCLFLLFPHSGTAWAQKIGLTAEEKAYIAAHPVFSASNEENWPPFNFNSNGLPQGYSVDYMNMLARMTGLRVRYVTGPQWDAFEHMLREGSLDVLMNMAVTPAREAYTDFTPPYATLVHGIVYRDNAPAPPTLETLGGRTVAVPKGFFTETVLRQHYPDIALLTPPDTLGCLQAVASGKADAAIGSLPVQNYLIQKNFLNNLRTVALLDNKYFPTVNIRFGVSKEKPMLARILSKAMATVGEREMSALRQKWLSADRMNTKYIPLTPPEQAMLSRLGVVRMCVHPDAMPLSHIDAAGRFEGMAADSIRLMASRIGVDLKLVPTQSWEESQRFLTEEKCDIIPAIPPTPARQKSMAFTRAYLTFPVVAATLQDTLFVPDMASLSGKTIGAVRGQAWTEEIIRDYPEVRLVETANVEDGLQMVRDRKLYAFVDTMAAITYAIGKDHFTDLKIAGKLENDLPLAVGVNRSNPLLARVFDMAVASLSEKERRDIFSHWISVSFEHGFNYALLWKILAGVAVIMAAIFLWNRKLVRLNQAVTRANADLNRANGKISTLLDNSGQGFLSCDATGTVGPELSGECDRLFGRPAAGVSLAELLYPDDIKARETFAGNIKRILAHTDSYTRDLLLSLMPGHFVLGDKQVDAAYKPLGDAQLMLVLTDVTDKRALAAEVERERRRLAMIVAAVREKDDFRNVLDAYERFIKSRVRGTAGESADGGWDLPSLYRHVHTFKGLLQQLECIRSPEALHRLESVLAGWQADGVPETDRQRLESAWKTCGCDVALHEDLQDIRAALGDDFFEGDRRVPVPVELIERLEGYLAGRQGDGDDASRAEGRDLLGAVRRLRRRDLRDMLGVYSKTVRQLAARTGKRVAPLAVEGDAIAVSPQAYAPLVSALVHVFRNAIVHGIEYPDQRQDAGKEETGRIDCRVKDLGDAIRITIEDDGQGIALKAVQDRARELGIEPSGNVDKDLNLIFERDMTTQKSADTLSGRGVGLFAVMDELKRFGGTVRVTSVPGKGTTFFFTVPKAGSDKEAANPGAA